jgi:hypothetical protein
VKREIRMKLNIYATGTRGRNSIEMFGDKVLYD